MSRNGQLVGAVATFIDITDRIERDSKLLKLSRAVENSPASIVITDSAGTIEYINQKFTEVTGYSAQEVIGQNSSILKTGTYAPKFYEHLWQTILSGQTWHGEFHNRKKNGESYFEAASLSPILDNHGKITHFVAVKEDITERKLILQELKKAKLAAEAASQSKGDFLANMSHEIRTPMNAIIGLSYLCMQTELSTLQRDYLHKVHGAAKSLLGIINDVLDFSKIEAGKMEMEQVPFSLREVSDNVSIIVSASAEEKGLELSFEIAPELPIYLVGDPLRLGQVLINLTANAIKFSETGTVRVLAEPESDTAEHVTLRFTVSDSGIGMSPDQIERLFQAFSQADSSTTRKFGGTGLGLSISHRIVGLMNGKIWAQSTPGKGSDFIFTACFGKAAKDYGSEIAKAGSAQSLAADGAALFHPRLAAQLAGASLLLVEDNKINQMVAREMLEKAGIAVAIAENGAEAIEMLSAKSYDGVLMDMQMPVMDGLCATREIRSKELYAHLPIIAMTANAMAGDRLKCLQAGMNDYIAKPLDPALMMTTLARWIIPARPLLPPLHALADAAELPDLPDVNVAAGVRRMSGSIEGYYTILDKFRDSQQNVLAEIRQAVALNDWEKADLLAHTLKGLLGTLGAESLQTCATGLETDIVGRASLTIEATLAALNAKLVPLFADIDRVLQQRILVELPAGSAVDMAELSRLIALLKVQLEQFDMRGNDTIEVIRKMVSGNAALKLALLPVERYLSGYDYEQGLSELNNFAANLAKRV